MNFDPLTLVGIWSLWCLGHSLLAAEPVKSWLCRWFKGASSFYRLFYNVFALLTLVPVLYWSFDLSGDVILAWRGYWRLLQGGLWFVAGVLVWSGFRVYPLSEFLGVDSLRRSVSLPEQQTLVTEGVLGLVRHPWYLAGFICLWSRDLTVPALVTSIVLSTYLVVGAIIEGRRLRRHFGRLYDDYRTAVPMLLPWRWLLVKIGAIFRR